LHKFHWLPSVFLNLDIQEKAFVIAAIDIRMKEEEKEAKKLKRK
jgi:hypothetical protein